MRHEPQTNQVLTDHEKQAGTTPKSVEMGRPLADLSPEQVKLLPLGFQSITLKRLLSESTANGFKVRNETLGFKAMSNGCIKPLSKIVEFTEE